MRILLFRNTCDGISPQTLNPTLFRKNQSIVLFFRFAAVLFKEEGPFPLTLFI